MKSALKTKRKNQIYDLEDRTLEFSKRIIKLCKSLSKNPINNRLIDQIIRSATSVGGNYREANETETKKDFRYKIYLCRKEAKETSYWLELIIEANLNFKKRIISLYEESVELRKIFSTIANNSKSKNTKQQ